jgi:hypothetical protein
VETEMVQESFSPPFHRYGLEVENNVEQDIYNVCYRFFLKVYFSTQKLNGMSKDADLKQSGRVVILYDWL